MPILLKKIEASIISLFGPEGSSEGSSSVKLITSVVGEVGIEDYIKLSSFEALTQDFSSVWSSSFCTTTPTTFGLGKCGTYTDLNISY